jgi:hypothetical protein
MKGYDPSFCIDLSYRSGDIRAGIKHIGSELQVNKSLLAVPWPLEDEYRPGELPDTEPIARHSKYCAREHIVATRPINGST